MFSVDTAAVKVSMAKAAKMSGSNWDCKKFLNPAHTSY